MAMRLACRTTFLDVEYDEGFSDAARSARRATSAPPTYGAQRPVLAPPVLSEYVSTLWARSGLLMHSDIQGGRTLIIRNLPCSVTQERLLQVIASLGLGGQCTWVYIPVRKSVAQAGCKKSGLGYAFINVHTEEDEELFTRAFTGLRWSRSPKVCQVERARLQGLGPN
eukprot:CAMPEP_0195073688 /NCGR_PEP_ID=MMETSP0448-20130528/16952_1 /TAXON_ID=66468 /ORGANISM="Heterocapsa triquestra, Strain CCMP 448" /LENGTH=167 /DNA_ID=CAMNT_0040105819 /DNA_START=95 /DNA_END=595 /DNA_ORIENTATION=+